MRVMVEIGDLSVAEVELACAHISKGKNDGFGSTLFKYTDFRISSIEDTAREHHEAIQAVYKK